MSKSNFLGQDPKSYERIIDANINRLKEGIRVIEDIARYIQNNKTLTSKLKLLRHNATIKNQNSFLASRDIKNDVSKHSTKSEQTRLNLEDILSANYKRAEESARVLEEIFKLLDIDESQKFKNIRYELYDLEKDQQKDFKVNPTWIKNYT